MASGGKNKRKNKAALAVLHREGSLLEWKDYLVIVEEKVEAGLK